MTLSSSSSPLLLRDFLFDQRDIFVDHILTYLSPLELLNMALTCRYLNHLIFVDEHGDSSMWIFKMLCRRELLLNHGAFGHAHALNSQNGENHHQENVEEESSSTTSISQTTEKSGCNDNFADGDEKMKSLDRVLNEQVRLFGDSYKRLFMELFRTYCFDLSQQRSDNESLPVSLHFSDHNTVFRCYKSWHSAIAKKKLVPGSVYRWRFIVEQFELGTNSFEMILGAVIPKENQVYEPDQGGSHFYESRLSVGISVNDWAERLGSSNIKIQTSQRPAVIGPGDEFGFVFDYTQSIPLLDVYYNGKRVIHELKVAGCPENQTYHPVASLCTKKSVRIAPWLDRSRD